MNKKNKFDVIVIGGGINGMLMALALSHIGMDIVIIEKTKFIAPKIDNDGRAISISPGSAKIMEKFGVWQKLSKFAEKINHIRVLDNHSSFFLDFENKHIGKKPLGYIIQSFDILNTIHQLVLTQKNITIIDQNTVQIMNSHTDHVIVKLSNGEEIQAKMGIIADGKNSNARSMLGITSIDYDYDQTAMVLACSHKKHHMNTAIEHFMPSGPFAILPLPGGYRSGIVWTERTELAKEYIKMPKSDFEDFLNAKFTDYLGPVKQDSKVISYPLALKFSNIYYKERFVLIGDAAHSIHPLAGQGLNLGIQDIGLLSELIEQNNNIGLDIADPIILDQYQKIRKFDNTQMLLMTHTLDRLFANHYTILKPLRKIGLSIVNKMDRLKTNLMLKAMGNK